MVLIKDIECDEFLHRIIDPPSSQWPYIQWAYCKWISERSNKQTHEHSHFTKSINQTIAWTKHSRSLFLKTKICFKIRFVKDSFNWLRLRTSHTSLNMGEKKTFIRNVWIKSRCWKKQQKIFNTAWGRLEGQSHLKWIEKILETHYLLIMTMTIFYFCIYNITRGSLSLYSWYAWDRGQIPIMAVTGPNR